VILLVSHRGDDHLAPVLAGLRRRRRRVELLDTARFPRRGAIDLRLGGRAPARLHLAAGPAAFLADELKAVWWRRSRPCQPDPRVPLSAHREFARRETAEALAGLFQGTRALWVNDPGRDREAGHKVGQLQAARACGLRVPRTCVTNRPARARAFLGELLPGDAVCKALHASPEAWYPTRLLVPGDRELLPLLRQAPVLLQEYVPGVDLRVTCVGRRLFASEIDARRTPYPADFRLGFGQARVRPARLPREVARGLRALVARLGLRYAAVDLRRTDEGEHLFLEVNPSGQFLFVEKRTGQPIAEALCDLLAGG